MNFSFNLEEFFPHNSDNIVILNFQKNNFSKTLACKKDEERFRIVIDNIGIASSKAQKLEIPVTSFQRIKLSDQILYIKIEGQSAIGFIKVGRKDLFYYTTRGEVLKINPLCVLDFYICENKQRLGFGKLLFDQMLNHEGLEACKLAFDRPSTKFLYFLRKHYNLSKYIPQSNNFIIFDNFFKETILKTEEKVKKTDNATIDIAIFNETNIPENEDLPNKILNNTSKKTEERRSGEDFSTPFYVERINSYVF